MKYIFYSICGSAIFLVGYKVYQHIKVRGIVTENHYQNTIGVPITGWAVNQYNQIFWNGKPAVGYAIDQQGDIVDSGFNLIKKNGFYTQFQVGN